MSESITKTGIVTKIEEEAKSKDGRTFKVYNLHVDGKKYGLGYKRKLVDDSGVKTGDTVRVTIVKKDGSDYWNVDSLEKVDPATTSTQPTTQTSTAPTPTTNGHTDYSQINRREALKVAVQMVSPFATDTRRKVAMPLDQQLGKIVAYADYFVKYVETGKVELASVEDARKLTEEGVEA